MNLSQILKEILSNQRLPYYIIAIQIPTIFCLIIQCSQAYKLQLREFKFVALAWCSNLIYLILNVLSIKFSVKSQYWLFTTTFFDLLSMYFFLIAAINWFNKGILGKLKRVHKIWFILIFAIALVSKSYPGSLHIVPYVHLRFFPVAAVDFTVLFLLAFFFRGLESSFLKKHILFYSTMFYAFIQFLSILQKDGYEPNEFLLNIDNIGFSLGLIAKISIYISLSQLLINFVRNSSIAEKNMLLHKLNFATNILNIESQIGSGKKLNELRREILQQILDECLNLLNEKLGFYGKYNFKEKTIIIRFASDSYKAQIGYTYSVEIGITGKAVRTNEVQIMDQLGDSSGHFKFSNVSETNFQSDIDKDVKSALAIPITVDEQVIGVYLFESEKEKNFTALDVKILKALVSQASAAITNINLIQQIELSKALTNSLKQIDKNLVDKSLELSNILQFILKQSLDIVKAELGNIAILINPYELVLEASTNKNNIGRKIDINDSITGLAVLDGKTHYIEDINSADEITKKLYKNYLGDNLVCELVVPLIVKNEVIGVFNTESSKANKFTTTDIERIEGFAGQAAIAILILQLFENVSKHKSRLGALAEIEQLILGSKQGLPETLGAILQTGLSLINKTHGEILLLDNDKQTERVLIVKKSTILSEEGKICSMKSICGLSINRGEAVYLPFVDQTNIQVSTSEDRSFYVPTESERVLYKTPAWGKMRSEFVIPLIIQGKVIGVLNIESANDNDFLEDERRLLINLTLAASMAIYIAQQFDEISKKNKELENSVDKEKIEMSTILGKVVNHRIGNSVGAIRTIIKDKFLYGTYGRFSEEIVEQFNIILDCAQKVLTARKEIGEKIEGLLFAKPTEINFKEIEKNIKENKDFSKYEDVRIEIIGFDELKPILVNLALFKEGVIDELITNAIRSMPNGGRLLIQGINEKNLTVLKFTDEGCGIEPLRLTKIFDRGESKWPVVQGNGIGLSELKNIIEFLRGQVSVESELGIGTTFTIMIPFN